MADKLYLQTVVEMRGLMWGGLRNREHRGRRGLARDTLSGEVDTKGVPGSRGS